MDWTERDWSQMWSCLNNRKVSDGPAEPLTCIEQRDCRPRYFKLICHLNENSQLKTIAVFSCGIQSMIIIGTFSDSNSPVDSRITQEQQVEYGVSLEEVDERPAQDPAAQRQQDQTGRDQSHIPQQRRRTRLRRLKHHSRSS